MDQVAGQGATNTQTNGAVDEGQLMARLHKGYASLKQQIHRVIVGQDKVIDPMLCCMLAGGHCIIQGVPGLAKTMMVHAISDAMRLTFNRIQFTPDLMPSDITGADKPHSSEDTGGASAGDAGARSYGCRQDVRA
jgi:MoxR-like ATPase